MIRFDTFYDLVKAQAAPEGVGENVVATFRTAVQNGLIAVQTDVPCYRDFHVDFVTKSYVRDFCNTDIFTGPRGTVLNVYAFKPGKDCTKYFYTQKSTSHIQCWIDEQRCTTTLCTPSNSTAIYDSPYCNYPIAGTEGCLPPYLPAGATEDDTSFISDCADRIFAIGPNYQIFLAPRFPCGYVVAVQWEGIKRTWADADPVFDDEDLKMAVAKFAEAQLAAKDRQWADVSGLKADFIDLTRQMAQRCRRERRTSPPRDCSHQIDHILPFVNPTPDSVSLAIYPDGTPGADTAPLAPSPNLTAINTGHMLWVDAVYGNDTLALREREDRPFLTLTAAKNAALSGDTIMVRPGTYRENNLMKAGVRYYGEPGAIIDYTDSYLCISTSTLLIGLGAKTLTVPAGLNLAAGDDVAIGLTENQSDPEFGSGNDPQSRSMYGTVTSYAGTTLVVNITIANNTGFTFSSWYVWGPSIGIFDDRPTGATGSFTVDGYFQLFHRFSNPGNLLSFGTVVITKATTFLNWHSQGSTLAAPASMGGNTKFGCFSIRKTGQAFISIDYVTDSGELWSNLDNVDPQTSGGGGAGFFWGEGETHITCQRNTMQSGYCLWCEEPPVAVASNCYYNGQLMSCTLSTLYVDTLALGSANYRIWLDCPIIIGGGIGLSLIGAAKVYVTAQKIQAVTAVSISGTELWLYVEKLTASQTWVSNSDTVDSSLATVSRNAHVNCQHFEESGGSISSGIINFSSANLFIHGGYLKGGTGSFGLVTHSATGRTKLIGCTLDSTANNVATNRPITVTTDGLQLQNCVILAGSNADSSIFAGAAKNVRCHGYSVATKAAHANITLTPNATYLIVDANAGL